MTGFGSPDPISVIEREEVFWWNIYESFVGDYYADFLPPEEVDDKDAPVGKYAEAIEKIVKDVYLTYKDIMIFLYSKKGYDVFIISLFLSDNYL